MRDRLMNPLCHSSGTPWIKTDFSFHIILSKIILDVKKPINTRRAQLKWKAEASYRLTGAQVVESRETTTRLWELPPKGATRNSPAAAMEEYQQSALIKSHPAARKWPFSPSRIFFYSLFISQAPAAHWSLHAGMSHSLASLWRIMKLPWVPLTATIHFKKPKKQNEKHQWRIPSPSLSQCVCVCVSRCGRVSQDGGWRLECEMYSEWVTKKLTLGWQTQLVYGV